MKASEVIRGLQEKMEVHGDLEVVTEGCDCTGDVEDIGVEPIEGTAHFILYREKADGVELPPKPTARLKDNPLLPEGDMEIVYERKEET
jgi:hypothetical protein